MSNIITTCNQKGGVGKTTTAINVSAYLAIQDKKTLLIDMDPQGNATSGLGVDKSSITKSIYDVLLNDVLLVDIIQNIHLKNLFIAPSSVDLTGAEIELVGAVAREYKLKNALRNIQDDYDYIIIDTPPSLGLLTINSLTACNSLLIPLQCEYYALEGLTKLLNTIDLVKKNLNPQIEIEGVVLTMADFRTRLAHEVIGEIRSYFHDKVYKTIIPRNVKLSEAPGYGKPIALYDEGSLGAQKYKELTQEILNHNILGSYKETDELVKEDPGIDEAAKQYEKSKEGEIE